MKNLIRKTLFENGMVYTGGLEFKEDVQISKVDFDVLNMNLEKLGYKLNDSLQEKLAYLSPEDFILLTVEIINLASEVALASQDLKIIFKNFEDAQTEDLEFIQVASFLTYLFPFLSDNYELSKIHEGNKTVNLKEGTDASFDRYVKALMNSRTHFNKEEKRLVKTLIENDYEIELYDITMAENRAFVISTLLAAGKVVNIKGVQELVDFIKVHYEDSDRAYSSKTVKLRKLTNADRNNILSMFDNLSMSENNIAKARYDLDFLKSLNRVLHARSKRNARRFPEAANFFEILETNNISQYKTPEAKALHMIADKDERVFDVLDENPGLYIRLISRLSNAFSADKAILKFILSPAEFNIEMLNQIKTYFLNILDENRLFFFGGKFVMVENESKMTEENVKRWLNAIDVKMSVIFKELENHAEKMVVLPSTKGWTVPKSNANSGELMTLSYGSKLSIPEDVETISFIVFWDEDVDIDLSSASLDSELKRKGSSIAYYNLVNDWGTHSGDVRGETQGSTEIITVNLEKAREAGVKYLVPNVILYSGYGYGSLLSEIGNLRFVVAYDLDARKGLNVKELDKHLSIKLSANSSESIPLTMDIEENVLTWVDTATNEQSAFSYSDRISYEQIIRHSSLRRPSIAEMAISYANAHDVEVIDSLDGVEDSKDLVIIAPATTKGLEKYSDAQIFTEVSSMTLNQELTSSGFKVEEEESEKESVEEVTSSQKVEESSIFDSILKSQLDTKLFRETLEKLA